MTFPLWTLLPFGALFLAGVVWFSRRGRQVYLDAAKELGLRLKQDGSYLRPNLEGSYQEYAVRVDDIVYNIGDSPHRYARVSVMPTLSIPTGLEIEADHSISKIQTFLGGQDIQTGNAEWDKALRIKGQDEQAVVRFLSQPARGGQIGDVLVPFVGQSNFVTFTQAEGAVWFLHVQLTSVSQLRKTLDRLVDVVRAMEGKSPVQ